MAYFGEIIALITAFFWALSVVFFRRLGGVFSPLALNFWKCIISCFGLFIVVFGLDLSLPQLEQTVWLLLSGVIGIGIGDTAFFAALNRIGERSTLLFAETMAPIFTAFLAMFWIAEWLSWQQWLAIVVIIFGVDIVVRNKKGKTKTLPFNWAGFGFAAIAAVCQAVGAVIGRDMLLQEGVDPVTASLIRLLGGMLLIIPLLMLSRRTFMPNYVATRLSTLTIWRTLLLATFLGTFIAMMLQMYSFANAEAAIVQSLLASCVIFSLIIAKIQGEEVTRPAAIGSLIAITGVFFIFVS